MVMIDHIDVFECESKAFSYLKLRQDINSINDFKYEDFIIAIMNFIITMHNSEFHLDFKHCYK
jgi:hypothetical protein